MFFAGFYSFIETMPGAILLEFQSYRRDPRKNDKTGAPVYLDKKYG